MTYVANTEPYAWPWDGEHDSQFDPARCAVVVCGAQMHWMASIAHPELWGPVTSFIAQLRSAGVLVVWIRHGSSRSAARPVDRVLPPVGDPSWELIEPVVPGDLVIDTPGLDGFSVLDTEIELRSREIDRLVMVGVGTETVVSSTCRSANDRGFECLTVIDGGLHVDDVAGAASLSSVCMSGGIFGAIGSMADVVAALPTNR